MVDVWWCEDIDISVGEITRSDNIFRSAEFGHFYKKNRGFFNTLNYSSQVNLSTKVVTGVAGGLPTVNFRYINITKFGGNSVMEN